MKTFNLKLQLIGFLFITVETMLKTNWKRSKEKEIAPELEWEEKYIMSDELKDEMETMWEVVKIRKKVIHFMSICIHCSLIHYYRFHKFSIFFN